MKSLKALLADDEATIRELSRYILQRSFPNLSFDEVENGKAALEKLKLTKYDFILSDWEMPYLCGYDLLLWVRKHSEFKDTPFLIVSALDQDRILKAEEAGATAYITKPYTVESLVRTVAEVVDKLNRRQFERITVDGSADMHYEGSVLNGNIIDISRGGMFGAFRKKETIPKINESVLIDITLKNKGTFNGLSGVINRIQEDETAINTENVRIAFKFLEIATEELIN
jgi:two-component system chemotaxis response regulator CheY